MDQHRATSDERHREIARSMGFDDEQMKLVEMYLALSHEDRVRTAVRKSTTAAAG